jgi:hypothetical protein
LALAVGAASATLAVIPPALCAQAPAAAPVGTIQVGETVTGTLEPGEPSESRYNDYLLRLNAGDTVQIDLEAPDFDTFLELRRPGRSEPIDSNDDGGDSLNSRLIFNATETDDYIVRATRLFSGAGPYQLRVSRQAAVQRTTLVPGASIGGEFNDAVPLLPGGAGTPVRYRLYEFPGRARERVQLDLTSTELTPRLALVGAEGQVLIADTPASSNRHNARLIIVLPRDANYTVRATAPASQSGRFDLAFRQAPAAAAIPPAELTRGSATHGRFSFDSSAEVLGSQIRYFYRDFTLPVRRGDVLTVDLESSDFDPLLEVGIASPIGFALARRDDDSGEGLNARLVLRPSGEGVLTVRARSVRTQIGCFTVRVTQGALRPPSSAPASGAAAAGTPAPPAAAPQLCPETAAATAPARP